MRGPSRQSTAHAWWRTWGAALAALVALAAIVPAHAAPARSPCLAATARTEAALGIPPQLLSAIALAESGRWDRARKEVVAWPWVIYAEGKARYAPSKAGAIAEVERIRARGVRNIDVGCMQVNLHHHPDAFRSLDEAFDPAANVAYAGAFLKRLKNSSRSWSRSIGLYHSSRPEHGRPYRIRVQRLWRGERRRAALELRAERAERYRLRKAAIAAARGPRL